VGFDLTLFNLIHGLAGKSRVLDLLGIFLAEYLGYFLLFLVLYLIFFRPIEWKVRYRQILYMVLTLILSRGLFTEIIRFFYYRPRPFLVLDVQPLFNHEATPALPSGHAAFYFALALSVFYFIDRPWGWKLIIAVSLMGLARIFGGVHWPLDIAAGFAVALVSIWLVRYLLNRK
jgi:undecaprenyl-diphosphatase